MRANDLNRELEIRDIATSRFAIGDYKGGDTLLADNAGLLSDFIKLECMGNRFFYERKLQDAVRCYEEGISLNPDHLVVRYQYLVGTQLEKQGDLVEAFKRYQSAIEIDPKFIDTFLELGGLLVKVEDFEGALRCYRDAFELDSTDSKNVFNLKGILEKLVANGEAGLQSELDQVKKLSEEMIPPDINFKW